MDAPDILSNRGYFARFRELAQTMGVQAAWERVESELPFGLRRFTSFTAFERAKKKECVGELPEVIIFKLHLLPSR